MTNLLTNSNGGDQQTIAHPIITPTEKRKVRVDFTAEQIYTLSIQLAKKTRDLAAMEEEKTTVSSQYTAKVKQIKSDCNVLSNKVTDGYEMQEVDCTVKYHFPERNKKTYTRSDNGTQFTEPMDSTDHNLFNQESDVDKDDAMNHLRKKKRKRTS